MEDVKQQLADLVRELLEAQQGIDLLHADLAAQPDLEGKREAQLLELMAARDEVTTRLGKLVSKWLRSGGQVELLPPAPATPSQATPAIQPAFEGKLKEVSLGALRQVLAPVPPPRPVPAWPPPLLPRQRM